MVYSVADVAAVTAEEKSELSYEYTETVLPTVFAGAAEQVRSRLQWG